MVEFSSRDGTRIARTVRLSEQRVQNTIHGNNAARSNQAHAPMLIVRVRNQTASPFAEAAPVVLKLSDEGRASTDSAFEFDDVYWGHTPTDATSNLKLGVTLEPIPIGQIGIVAISGIVTAQANITSPAHSAVTISNGAFVSTTSGFPIVAWRTQTETGSIQLGVQYVQIMLNNSAQQSTSGDFPIIYIQNTSGFQRQNREIVGVSTPIIYPVDNFPTPDALPMQPVFLSSSPTPNSPFAILLGLVNNGDIAQAVTVGVVAVKINYTDRTHSCAVATDNQYVYLTSAADGPAQIIWRQNANTPGNGTFGQQWAMVSLNQRKVPSEDVRGYSYHAIPAAFGFLGTNIAPGVGLAILYDQPGSFGGASAAGAAWTPQASPVTVENWMFGTIDANQPLLLRTSRKDNNGNTIYTVVSQGCAAIPTGSG